FGLILATSGVVGLWGIGFFSFELVRAVFRQSFVAEGLRDGEAEMDRELVRLVAHRPGSMEEAVEKVRSESALFDADASLAYKAALKLHKGGEEVTPAAILAALPEGDRGRLRSLVATEPEGELEPLLKHVGERTQELESNLTFWAGVNGLLFNIGAF